MPKVFQHIGTTDASRHAQEIATLVRTYGRLGKAELARLVFSRMGADDFEKAIQICITAKLVSIRKVGTDIYICAAEDKGEKVIKAVN